MEEFMTNSEKREAGSAIQSKLIDSILKLDPNFAMAKVFNWWGAATDNQEKVISAYESIDKVSDLESRFITAAYERRVNGSIIKQDQIMDALIKDYPEHWQLRVFSGDIKNDLLDARGSEKRWEEALELNPSAFNALFGLVFLHIESGSSTMLPANDRDLEKAKGYLETVRALNPNSSQADRFMGNIYRKENDLDKALAAYQKSNNMIEDKESQLYRNGLLMQGHVYTFKGEYEEGRKKYYEGRSGALENKDYQWSMAFTNYIAQGYLYQKDLPSFDMGPIEGQGVEGMQYDDDKPPTIIHSTYIDNRMEPWSNAWNQVESEGVFSPLVTDNNFRFVKIMINPRKLQAAK